LPLVVVRKRPTLTSFHPTPPGSSSLLQVSISSEEVHPAARQPARNMADMKTLLNSLYEPPEVSLHLTTARLRFIPSARPFGARDVERGER
jgi:hypothetical protein